MTKEKKSLYRPVEELEEVFRVLENRKFQLDCGHHVTFFSFLGQTIVVLNDNKRLRFKCTECWQ